MAGFFCLFTLFVSNPFSLLGSNALFFFFFLFLIIIDCITLLTLHAAYSINNTNTTYDSVIILFTILTLQQSADLIAI